MRWGAGDDVRGSAAIVNRIAARIDIQAPAEKPPTQRAGAAPKHHRTDIDGLRAIAVLPVLLFHAGIRGFSGGFTGVDVFFVISGFLITGIIYGELESGTFTIARFYERRVRRIFPALFVLLAAVFAIGLVVLVPPDLKMLGKSTVATAVFASNIFFYRQAGYFDTTAETKPLLHSWSLAVEEQYYILFPLLLMVVHRRWRGALLPTIVAGTLISFAISVVLVSRSQTAAFFLPQSRIWELLMGSALSLAPRLKNSALAFAGLLSIVLAILLLGRGTPFPGFAALLPCAGAGAILLCGEGTAVGWLLSLRALRFVGKISYSLYLWHWPILVFAKFLYGDVLGLFGSSLCLGLSIVIATLSWRYVETPFRKRGRSPAQALFASVSMIAAAIALGCVAMTGLPSRLPRDAAEAARISQEPFAQAPGCLIELGRNPKGFLSQCLGPNPPQTVLWGDSHALQYAGGLHQRLGPSFRQAVRGGCAPIDLTPVRSERRPDQDCAQFNAAILQALVVSPEVRTVVLSGRWARFDFPFVDDEAQGFPGVAPERRSEILLASLNRLTDRLRRAGKRVVLIGMEPEFRERLPICISRALWLGRRESICSFRLESLPGSRMDRALKQLSAKVPGLILIRPSDSLCAAGQCPRTLDGLPITRDRDHLSNYAAQKVAARVVDAIKAGSSASDPVARRED